MPSFTHTQPPPLLLRSAVPTSRSWYSCVLGPRSPTLCLEISPTVSSLLPALSIVLPFANWFHYYANKFLLSKTRLTHASLSNYWPISLLPFWQNSVEIVIIMIMKNMLADSSSFSFILPWNDSKQAHQNISYFSHLRPTIIAKYSGLFPVLIF